MAANWFEDLMGFQERSYEETRANLEVIGTTLRSRVNHRSFSIGELERDARWRAIMKINRTEKNLLRAVERGEWKPTGVAKGERARYERYAKATQRKGCRLTISLSKRDFEAIQERALAAGVSCEILAATVLQKYASRCVEENVGGTSIQSHRPLRKPASGVGVRKTGTSDESVELIVPRLLNLRQAAKYLGCSFWTVRDYVLQGLIPVVHLPPLRARPGSRQRVTLRRVVIDRADLDKFVETHKGRAALHG
jgi:predicted DNA binding CopG/RHH family protein